jgi:hypothetical protein
MTHMDIFTRYGVLHPGSRLSCFRFQRLFNPLFIVHLCSHTIVTFIQSKIQLSAAMFIYNVHTPSKTFALPYKGSSIVPLLFRAELMIRFHRG